MIDVRALADAVNPSFFREVVFNREQKRTTPGGGYFLAPPSSLTSRIVLDKVAIGESFAELISDLAGPLTYSFIINPSSLFSMSSNFLQVNGILEVSDYTIIIQVTNGSQTENVTVSVTCIEVADSWAVGIRPFAPSSPCNTPLSNSVNYTPVAWPVSTGFNYFTGVKFFFNIPDPSETTIVSWTAPASWGNPTQVLNEVATPGFNGVKNLLLNGDNDNEAVLIAGTKTINIFNFNRNTDTTATSGAYAFDNLASGTGFGTVGGGEFGQNLGAGIVATGSNLMMGSLIKEEFTHYGEFNHWIAFSMIGSITQPGFLPPAISGDGTIPPPTGLFQEGQLLAIPRTTSIPGGLSIYGQAMFRAMRDYGAWCMDTSGSVTPYMGSLYDPTQAGASIPYSAPTSWTATDKGNLINDCNILFPLLQIVS